MKQTLSKNLINDFLDHLEIEKNCSKLTIRNYKHYLERFRRWCKKTDFDSSVESIDLQVIRKYRLYLSRLEHQPGKTLSPTTQSYHIIALRSFLKWLAKNDVEVLSAEKIDLPRGKSHSLKFLNQELVEKLLTAPDVDEISGLRDRAILELLFSTGLRVSELAKLNRDRIDFKAREFGIIGKGGRARVVFLSDQAAYWLKKYFDKRDDDWKPAFIRYARHKHAKTKDGEDMRLSVRSIQRTVEKYRVAAKLPVDITPHGLRHSFATDLLFHGAGLREVQEMLGHKNISTTQIYTHVTNPQLKNVHKKYHSGNTHSTSKSEGD